MKSFRFVLLAATFAISLLGGAAASVDAADSFSSGPQVKLPPGWCYSDPIGTYDCRFKIRPFPSS